MAVYTFATAAFYLLGAAVLWRTGLNPEGQGMIRTLAEMYVPVFGPWAEGVFLFGAVAVLYSTFFVAAAGNARMVADGLGLFGLTDGSEAARLRWTRRISAAWPLVALAAYVFFRAPVAMVLASGVAQALMLPMLGGAALYFRYRRLEDGLAAGAGVGRDAVALLRRLPPHRHLDALHDAFLAAAHFIQLNCFLACTPI